ncbi:MAG: FtsW/RodA/SpoVE family cell cycle protein, partial [Firmicutes bacterium]|nr:FtsW/RodA/SpoVE family cell cycle protein [Bacillota bacterium]
EVAKFLFVFYLASEFSGGWNKKKLFISAGFALGILLVLMYQRDLGAALIFFVTYLIVLYCVTGKFTLFLGGVGFLAAAALLAYNIFGHVKARAAGWLDPWADPSDGGYQILQSLFAITTFGFLGAGLGQGVPNRIPVVEKDMIFAAICEELGGIFGIALIALYLVFIILGIKVALRGRNLFTTMLAVGFTSILGFQFFLIIGGVTGFLPLTGVTMPFVSYGGTSMVVSLITAGIIQWLYMVRMPENEYDGLDATEDALQNIPVCSYDGFSDDYDEYFEDEEYEEYQEYEDDDLGEEFYEDSFDEYETKVFLGLKKEESYIRNKEKIYNFEKDEEYSEYRNSEYEVSEYEVSEYGENAFYIEKRTPVFSYHFEEDEDTKEENSADAEIKCEFARGEDLNEFPPERKGDAWDE